MDQRTQALDAALTQIERQFGKGSIMKLGDDSHVPAAAISTGCLSLDIGLGIGGVPRGRVVEIFGPESSGKTTLVYHIIAEAQKQGGIAAFIDAEHAMDPAYARRIGVNVDELLVSQPDNGEQALEIAELLVRSGAIDVVAIDSVAALVPKAEIEGEMGDSFVGLQARLMSQALRKLTGGLNRTGTVCVFTNQLREKIGVMFGSPEVTPGGRALKFYASIRLDIRRIETLKDGGDAYGNRVRVKVVKNKMAPPFRQAEFDIIYGEGISWEGSVLDVGLENKVVQKSGSYFSFDDTRLGQGRANAVAFLKEHPDMHAGHPRGDREGRPVDRDPGHHGAAAVRRGGRGDRERPGSHRPARRGARQGVSEERDRAMRRAGELLARRAHGRDELRRKLARGGDDDVAAEVIDDLARMGYVDDERYAAALAEHRLARGWGPLRIEHDLLAAGVPEAVVNAAVAALDRDDVREAALRAIGERTGAAAARRLGARGFDEDVAERPARRRLVTIAALPGSRYSAPVLATVLHRPFSFAMPFVV